MAQDDTPLGAGLQVGASEVRVRGGVLRYLEPGCHEVEAAVEDSAAGALEQSRDG